MALSRREFLVRAGLTSLGLALTGLVAYAALPNHCSFFVMSPAVMHAHSAQLKAYNTSKGTIRFQPGKPIPEALIRKLVRARVAENKARASTTPRRLQATSKTSRKKQAR